MKLTLKLLLINSLALGAVFLPASSLIAGPDHNHDTSTDDPEWVTLFDGKTLHGWRGYHSTEIPQGWSVNDGMLMLEDGDGDLITTDQYQNFELSLEWKVAEAGNSGIFFLAQTGHERIYLSAPEMQILDDAGHADGADPLTSAGANYGLYPAPRGVVRPAGEWNQAAIRVNQARVVQWLNGQKIVEFDLWSDDWKQRVSKSKFSKWPAYGQSVTGHIGLQDHGDPVWFRNIRIKVID